VKITRITAWRADLPRGRVFRLSGGRQTSSFDTTLVRVETDAGIAGLGEVCPLGSAYLPAYAAGVHTGLAEIAPQLLGEDPTAIERFNRTMDGLLKGHPYVKSALDLACWDILGRAAGLPVVTLLGGRQADAVPLYQPISHDAPKRMAEQMAGARAEGYVRFQPKVGGEPEVDILRLRAIAAAAKEGELVVCDANGSWLTHEAKRVLQAARGLGLYIEQPCLSYEECLSVRRHYDGPMVLDECIDSLPALLRAHADGALDAVNIKLSKVGGLTKARLFRDLCVQLGIPMTIEDAEGGDVVGAAIASLAQSTPPKLLFSVANAYFTVKRQTTDGAIVPDRGRVAANRGPGYGLALREGDLGAPLLDIR